MQEAEIVAALGPTNTGKTHRAIQRMLEHPTGSIGLPLRLLAREVFDRVVAQVGQEKVALVTGEEKVIPHRPRYFVCTVEAMPIERPVDFLAVDEIQLAEHHERGHVFTDRLLHARGQQTTWFMGAATMLPLIRTLVPTAQHLEFPRFSTLRAEAPFSLGTLPPRSAVVGFSADRVYELAEKLKGRRGGAAVVLGALSPRARNAQVALYQEGEVDYLVATDAIGMGLNLDLDHVAFADMQKFDGREIRPLELSELGQIAGRAGRYQRDGGFSTFLRPALSASIQRAIAEHRYPAVHTLTWRNSSLDFSDPEALVASLQKPPPAPQLRLITNADDSATLRILLTDREVRKAIESPERLELLWSTCQIPDYRKLLIEHHARFVKETYLELVQNGQLNANFLLPRIEALLSHTGDIDTIMGRIKNVRTYSYVANQRAWVDKSLRVAERAHAVEDQLSDALHAALLARFVERKKVYSLPRAPSAHSSREPGRASFVDRLADFSEKLQKARHAADPSATRRERARLAASGEFKLDQSGQVTFEGEPCATLRPGRTPLEPSIAANPTFALGDSLPGRILASQRERALGHFLTNTSADEPGAFRGILYQLREGFGVAPSASIRPLFEELAPAEQKALLSQGFILGQKFGFLRSQLRPASISQRLPWLRIYYFARGAPRVPFDTQKQTPFERPEQAGKPSFPAGKLPEEVWNKLGYAVVASVALRLDLFETLAHDAQSHPHEQLLRKTMSLLQAPKRAAEGVVRGLQGRNPFAPSPMP